MYLNDGNCITNTPNTSAAYNTWVYNTPNIYQRVPSYYTDEYGNRHEVLRWGSQCFKRLPGGMYKATPTRTGSWYQENYVQVPCPDSTN